MKILRFFYDKILMLVMFCVIAGSMLFVMQEIHNINAENEEEQYVYEYTENVAINTTTLPDTPTTTFNETPGNYSDYWTVDMNMVFWELSHHPSVDDLEKDLATKITKYNNSEADCGEFSILIKNYSGNATYCDYYKNNSNSLTLEFGHSVDTTAIAQLLNLQLQSSSGVETYYTWNNKLNVTIADLQGVVYVRFELK